MCLAECPVGLDHNSIIAFVGQYRLRLNERQQHIRSIQITGLAWRERKANRIAQGIHRGVDLGA